MKQFKMPNSEVVVKIKKGAAEELGQEKLLGLMKILPTSEEVCETIIHMCVNMCVYIH